MIHSRFLYWIDNKVLDLFPFYMFTNFTKSLNNSLQDVDILFVIRGNLVRFFLINTDPYFANTLKLSIFRQLLPVMDPFGFSSLLILMICPLKRLLIICIKRDYNAIILSSHTSTPIIF